MNRSILALAGGAVLVGAVILAGVPGIDPGIGYDRVGPRAFPVAVGAGLVLMGARLAFAARLRKDAGKRTGVGERAGIPRKADATIDEGVVLVIDRRALAYAAAGMLLFAALVSRAGFVAAASVQFWLVARAFGDHRPWRDAAAALVLSIAVHLAFSKGLGLTLP
jgi:putative tricarboxylic transport membrane protein